MRDENQLITFPAKDLFIPMDQMSGIDDIFNSSRKEGAGAIFEGLYLLVTS